MHDAEIRMCFTVIFILIFCVSFEIQALFYVGTYDKTYIMHEHVLWVEHNEFRKYFEQFFVFIKNLNTIMSHDKFCIYKYIGQVTQNTNFLREWMAESSDNL